MLFYPLSLIPSHVMLQQSINQSLTCCMGVDAQVLHALLPVLCSSDSSQQLPGARQFALDQIGGHVCIHGVFQVFAFCSGPMQGQKPCLSLVLSHVCLLPILLGVGFWPVPLVFHLLLLLYSMRGVPFSPLRLDFRPNRITSPHTSSVRLCRKDMKKVYRYCPSSYDNERKADWLFQQRKIVAKDSISALACMSESGLARQTRQEKHGEVLVLLLSTQTLLPSARLCPLSHHGWMITNMH